MPQVPVYESQYKIPGVGTVVHGDVAAAGAPGETLRRGALVLTEQLGTLADKLQAANDAADLEKGLAAARRDLLQTKLDALQPKTVTNDDGTTTIQPIDYALAPQSFVDAANAIRDKYAGAFKSPAVATVFNREFDRLSTTAEFDIRAEARKGIVQTAQGSLDDTLTSLVPLAVHAVNPVARQAAIDQGRIAIGRMQALGVIDPLAAQKREKAFLGQIDEADVLGRFNGSEDDVNATVSELQSGAFPHLDAVATERLIRTGQSRADALARERISSADRAERQAALTLRTTQAKNEAALIAQVQADPNSVSEVDLTDKVGRQEISPEGLNAIRTVRQRSLAGVDDPRTIVDLQDRSLKGEDIHDAVIAATGKGLSGPTAARLLTENQQRVDQRGKEDWHTDNEKNAYQYVGTYLGKDKLAFAFDDDTAQRLASAQREFIARVKDRNEDPWKVADDIVGKYGRTAAAPPAVGYGLGQPQSQADVVSFGNRLRAMRDGGRIAQPDYEREMRVLQRWNDLVAAKPPVQKAGK